MNFNPSFNEIGTQFVEFYKSQFDVPDPVARANGLSALYDPENSYMTFEGVQVKGRQAILEKFSVSCFKCISEKFSFEMLLNFYFLESYFSIDTTPYYQNGLPAIAWRIGSCCYTWAAQGKSIFVSKYFCRRMTIPLIHTRSFSFCDQTRVRSSFLTRSSG